MWGLKKIGPPRGMEPEEAFTWAIIMFAAYVWWTAFFPWYGR